MKLKHVMRVLVEYFGLILPTNILIRIIEDDEELKEIVLDGERISDTFDRELLITKVVEFLSHGERCEWPCNADSMETKEEFKAWLKVAVDSVDGVCCID